MTLQLTHHPQVDELPKFQALVASLCGQLQAVARQGIQLSVEKDQLEGDANELRAELMRNREELMKVTEEHRDSLSRLREEMMAREMSYQLSYQ